LLHQAALDEVLAVRVVSSRGRRNQRGVKRKMSSYHLRRKGQGPQQPVASPQVVMRIQLIWADGGYAGKLIQWVSSLRNNSNLRLEIVKRSDAIKGFYVLPRRWVVERTFGWLGHHRRLSKDYEFLPETSENIIRVAMIKLMVRRLALK
jgi:transposase